MPNSKITFVLPAGAGEGLANVGGADVATGVGTGDAVGFMVAGGAVIVGVGVGGVIVGGVIVGGVIVGGVFVGGAFVGGFGGVGPGPEPPPPPQATSVAAVATIKANETRRTPLVTKFMSSLI
jgi:hypothetical protein